MSDILTIAGAGIAGAGVVGFLFAPVLPMGSAGGTVTGYNSVMDQLTYSGASLGGILAYAGNDTLYAFIAMIVIGAVLMIVSMLGWV